MSKTGVCWRDLARCKVEQGMGEHVGPGAGLGTWSRLLVTWDRVLVTWGRVLAWGPQALLLLE